MNSLKITILLGLMTGILVIIGRVFGGNSGMMIMFVFSLGMNFVSYYYSDTWVLKTYGAREVSIQEEPALVGMVAKLARNANLPMPKVCIVDSNEANAFATGRNPEHAAVAVNTGLIRLLNSNELEGVLAHELSHIKNRDTLIGTVAASMAGLITMVASMARWGAILGGGNRDRDNNNLVGNLFLMILAPIAASLIQMAISRTREYGADKSGGEISGNPNYLADALEKMKYGVARQRTTEVTPSTAHMFIINPLSGSSISSWFSTHPDTDERITRLREQAKEMRIRR